MNRLKQAFTLPTFATPEEEAAFWKADYSKKYSFRCWTMFAGILAFAGFFVVDQLIAGDELGLILTIRFVTCALMFVAWVMFCANPSPAVSERIIFVYCLIAVLSNILMSTLYSAPGADYMPFSLSLLLAFGVGLIVPRFRSMAVLCIIGYFLYFASVPFSETSIGALAVNTHFFSLSVFAALVGSFAREKQEREQAQVEAKLAAASEEAIEANLSKDYLLANVSHELRTPVNAIAGFTEVMQRELFGPIHPPRYREYIDDVHRSAALLKSEISDLLDVSRLETGKMSWDEAHHTLEDVIATAVSILTIEAQEREIVLSYQQRRQKTEALTDPQRLTQALLNVISNSIKFSPPGSAIHIVGGLEADGGYAITVTDKGCGIASKYLDSVLEPFGQAHADSYSARKGGLGLGLAIANSIMHKMDGSIEIASEVDAGTMVTMRIPEARLRTAEAGRAIRMESA